MTFRHAALQLNLRTKFILPISLMLIVGMLIVSGYLLRKQASSFRRELETSGETMIRTLAVNAESGVLFESEYELNQLLQAPAQFSSVTYAHVENREGRILAKIGDTLLHKAIETGQEHKHTGADSMSLEYFRTATEKEVLILRAPVVTQKRVMTTEHLGITGNFDRSLAPSSGVEVIGYVELGLSLDRVNRSILEAQVAVIFFTVVVVIGAILVLALIVNAITKPITELVAVTDQISRGDFSRRVETRQNDEIGHLAETFNKMIGSLQQSRDEIEAYNRNLEEKIVERTLQLEHAQAQLIQSEKMSAIGQLAAGVAHELNNPLGGILGYAQFTLEKLQKNAPEKTTPKEIQDYIRYITDIETQARRCKMIVQNLLRFSRSSRSMDFEEVDVNKAIEETLSFVAHQLHLGQIDLVLELDPRLPHVYGNTSQLQQVFTNLIINAMHASKGGATVTVQTRFSPPLGEFAGAVEISVIDRGSGIKEEHLKRIFEPFFTTKEVGKGTGLGLSVSYGIVKEHGGEITVVSNVGEGSAFTVVLPVQKPEPNPDNSEREFSFDRKR